MAGLQPVSTVATWFPPFVHSVSFVTGRRNAQRTRRPFRTMIKTNIDAKTMMEAIARLKGVPLAKTVRNASRDFARGAKEATPIARIGKPQYYRLLDNAGNTMRYIPAARIPHKHSRKLKPVNIARGWSKRTWYGVFASLGIAHEMGPKPKGLSTQAAQALDRKSSAVPRESQNTAEMQITDSIPLNRFGKSGQNTALITQLIEAGFARAAAIMTKTYNELIKGLWNK